MGKVSKKILERIVTELREKTKLQSWKNTPTVIKWFKDLENKQDLSLRILPEHHKTSSHQSN